MEFFEIIFKFVCFFLEKSYHSNLAITFYVDHEWPNGFQHQIDQARNCPFRLSDDRWRHVRLRHDLLHNRKKWKSFKRFSEKRMKLELIKIALNESLISVLVNGQSVLAIFIPQKILEKIFSKNFGNFRDFFG